MEDTDHIRFNIVLVSLILTILVVYFPCEMKAKKTKKEKAKVAAQKAELARIEAEKAK